MLDRRSEDLVLAAGIEHVVDLGPVPGPFLDLVARDYPGAIRARSFSPKIFEPVWRQLRITHRVLDISVAKPCFECPLIMAGVRQGEARRTWPALASTRTFV